MKEEIEINERVGVIRDDYKERLERKLEMIFEKMLDVEDKLIYERIVREENEIKKQQHELDCHREELKYRKNDMFERNRKQREMFRKGYWD